MRETYYVRDPQGSMLAVYKRTCMRDDGWDDAPFLVTNACAQLEDWQVHGYQDDADEYTYEHNH